MGETRDATVPGLGSRRGVPRLVAHFDWSRIQLDDRHGFVLSRIDGRTTIGEVCLLSPFPEAQTLEILCSLAAAGMIEIPGAPPSAAAAAPTAGPEPRPPAAAPRAEARTGEFPIISRLADDSGDLAPELRARIDAMLALAAMGDPAALLGVDRGASMKEVRRAYHRLSKEFHPDRYFNRRLGPYHEKLQDVFKALTAAVEGLEAEAGSSA